MRITRIRITNFRSIRSLDLGLGETTVFIGPNNSGKTAILDAVRIALTRRWGQRGTGFTEYDVHLPDDKADPKSPPGVSIELLAEEGAPGEWPDALQQDLDNIIQTDASGRSFISLRASCAWSEADACFQPGWEFLNAAGNPMAGKSLRHTNLERFWRYLPAFYLPALRNVDDEFSSRSQFWGKLLKAMEIPPKLEGRVQRILDLLNTKLLRADPRLAQVAHTLSGVTRVSARDRAGEVNLRLVPLKSWDLLSKAEIILRNETDRPWLPLQRHGQGVQSLSIIFLFQAFVEHLISELFEVDSTPLLALEEPETHLHPQAARTLWAHVVKLPGQKLITTHSPYFVQHVPFRDLRLVRLTDNGTEVKWLPPTFVVQIPPNDALLRVVGNNNGVLEYAAVTQTLTVKGKLDEPLFRALLTCYGTNPERAQIHQKLRDLRTRSLLYISDGDLTQLETFARRIRGEIFFARRWFLVEGQGEYLIVTALARTLGYDLDEHGVSVIDAVNNGNPALFAALARALEIPWIAVLDNDTAGKGYVNALKSRDFDDAFLQQRCLQHASNNLEDQLLADGLEPELRDILVGLGQQDAVTISPQDLRKRLDDVKIKYAARLAVSLRDNPALAARMPRSFRDAIAALRGLA